MQPWKTLERKLVLDESPWLKVEHHKVELPSGQVIPNWQWVVTPDYINVVAVTEDGMFVCFRQVKYAFKDGTLAIVGGYLNEGEEPLESAKRELREETGYESDDWVDLGHYRVDPNRGVAVGHLYLARNTHFTSKTDSDDLEEQHLILLTRAEVEDALVKGEFKTMAWTTAIALALRNL